MLFPATDTPDPYTEEAFRLWELARRSRVSPEPQSELFSPDEHERQDCNPRQVTAPKGTSRKLAQSVGTAR
jgi:hypothetical protein